MVNYKFLLRIWVNSPHRFESCHCHICVIGGLVTRATEMFNLSCMLKEILTVIWSCWFKTIKMNEFDQYWSHHYNFNYDFNRLLITNRPNWTILVSLEEKTQVIPKVVASEMGIRICILIECFQLDILNLA